MERYDPNAKLFVFIKVNAIERCHVDNKSHGLGTDLAEFYMKE